MMIDQSELEGVARESAKRHSVPGAVVAVLHGSEIVAEAAVGVTNLNTGVPVSPETLFLIGSISKVWTSTLVMQLVDQGMVDLDASLSTYLPDLRLSEPGATERITVRHLLTHTSGLDEDLALYDGRDDDCISRFAELAHTLPQLHPPGAFFSYCNTGMILAGRLLEVLTGRSYDGVLQTQLVEPLGLEHTVTLPEEAILQLAAAGHIRSGASGELRVTHRWTLPRASGPAGGTICTSARDLLTFAGAHVHGGVSHLGARILSSDAAEQMQQMQAAIPGTGDAMGRGSAIGLGWRIATRNGRTILSHGGGNIGQYCQLVAVPELEFAVAILTNSFVSAGFHEDVLTVLSDRFDVGLGDEGAPAEEPASANIVDAARFVGTYSSHTGTFQVESRDGSLQLEGSVQPSWVNDFYAAEKPSGTLVPAGDDEFVLVSDETQYGEEAQQVVFLGGSENGWPQYLHVGLYAYRRAG